MTPAFRLIQLAIARARADPSIHFPIDDIVKDDPELMRLLAKADAGDPIACYYVIQAHGEFIRASIIPKQKKRAALTEPTQLNKKQRL